MAHLASWIEPNLWPLKIRSFFYYYYFSPLLWRRPVQVEVLEVDLDPLPLERPELVGALQHVAIGVQVHGRVERAVPGVGVRRRDVGLVANWNKEARVKTLQRG